MKRRTFIKTVLGAIGAFGVGNKIIEPVPEKPKINPDWISAPYEAMVWTNCFDPFTGSEWKDVHRFRFNGKTQQFERVA